MNKKNISILILLMCTCFALGFMRFSAFSQQGDPAGFLGDYLKDLKKIRLNIYTAPDSGNIRKIRLKFAEGNAGDFKHNSTGLKIRNADLEIHDIIPDNSGIKSIGSVYLHSAEINEKDLSVFTASYMKKARDVSVKIENGHLVLSAVYSGMKFVSVMEIYKSPNERNGIGIRFISIKAGNISAPRRLANFILKKYNPLLKKIRHSVNFSCGEISAQNGILKIY